MIEAVKDLIDKYQSITLEQLKSLWENEVKQNPECVIDGGWILSLITNFGSCACILCKAANQSCHYCIHKYNPKWNLHGNPCMDSLYYNMEKARTPEELYEYIPKRIEYLKYLIECSKTNL